MPHVFNIFCGVRAGINPAPTVDASNTTTVDASNITPADASNTTPADASNTTPADYTISSNLLTPVMKENTTVDASEAAPVYIMQKTTGKLVKVTTPIDNFPTHKAYLKLPASTNAKATLQLVFGNDNTTTAIDDISTSHNNDGKWYDLNGREINYPQHGVFVHNNKKVIMK